MTEHNHTTPVPGCYRCEISQDEVTVCYLCRYWQGGEEDDTARCHVLGKETYCISRCPPFTAKESAQ